MKKLLLIPLFALLTWGGVKLYDRLRPPTPSEIIREVHASIPQQLPLIITPTPPDVKVTWVGPPPPEKPRVRRSTTPPPRTVGPLPSEEGAPAVPGAAPRCLFWLIGEPGCTPQ